MIFGPNLPNEYAAYVFNIHQTQRNKYCNGKSEKFESITFLPIIYKSVNKIRKLLVNPKKYERKKKAIPIRFNKRNN